MIDYKKNVTTKIEFDGRYIFWKRHINECIFNGIKHQYWNQWCWEWKLCFPGYENIYYDGDHYIWKFGFGSLYLWYECNYLYKFKNI